MTQRGRTRNPGAIDSAIGAPAQMRWIPDWVTGRYYNSQFTNGPYGTVSPTTNNRCYFEPIRVPNAVTATSIGVEVSSAGGAGSTARLAIYKDISFTGINAHGPYELLLDAGNVATDGTGFVAATISQPLNPWIYWLAVSQNNVTSNATFRALPTTYLGYTNSDQGSPASTGVIYNIIWDSSGIVSVFPRHIPFDQLGATGTSGAIRILLGV